ncbi:MAG TPA: AsnC family transcriptional regulator [Nitrososphaeraceae archaeon]|nr:AsnC family transcriptional regulator [Nitrososphaeraceae archaeon]
MQVHRLFLDDKDLKIIRILSKDCRESFMSIGSAIGMTSKSVKARVDRMISTGVIEKFVLKVNPVALGYGIGCMLIVREHTANIDDIINRLNLVGDVSVHSKCMGGISTFCLAIKEGHEDKLRLLLDSLKPASVRIMFTGKLTPSTLASSNLSKKHELTETDLRIIKCLISNPRMELNDIAKETSISSRTVNRRLTRLKDDNMLKFFILCNPVHTVGYIQFALVVNTLDRSYYHQIVERIYGQLGENILFQLPVTDPDNVITLLLFSQDIFAADGILKKVESLDGVRRVELFVLTDTTSYDEWMLREIDKKLNAASTRRAIELGPLLEISD